MNINQKNLNVKLDLRAVIILLIVAIGVMLFVWKPWVADGDRTVSVTGEATLSAKPDEFVFYPSYNFKNADKDKALMELAKKSDEIASKLKSLGVANDKIKTNSSGFDGPTYSEPSFKDATYSLQFTVTVSNQTLAQKVQDYLLTTSPSGNVSPQANFSDAKRKELESQARDLATKDARTKVDQMSKNLGFTVGDVKSVSDNMGFGILPISERGVSVDSSGGRQLTIQPGENDLDYSVVVVYFIR